MKKMWAPWRIEYILSPKPSGCIFCVKPKESKDDENFILYRGQYSFIIMNYYPYNNGHLMVVPYRHLSDITVLNDEENKEISSLIQTSVKIIRKTMNAEGFNIGMNLGKTAGAGIDEHIHYHIVPRWNGDTNFMPVAGNSKVISQGLYETWETLLPHFQDLK